MTIQDKIPKNKPYRINEMQVGDTLFTVHFCVRLTASLMKLRYSSCGARASAGRNWIQFLYRPAKYRPLSRWLTGKNNTYLPIWVVGTMKFYRLAFGFPTRSGSLLPTKRGRELPTLTIVTKETQEVCLSFSIISFSLLEKCRKTCSSVSKKLFDTLLQKEPCIAWFLLVSNEQSGFGSSSWQKHGLSLPEHFFRLKEV